MRVDCSATRDLCPCVSARKRARTAMRSAGSRFITSLSSALNAQQKSALRRERHRSHRHQSENLARTNRSASDVHEVRCSQLAALPRPRRCGSWGEAAAFAHCALRRTARPARSATRLLRRATRLALDRARTDSKATHDGALVRTLPGHAHFCASIDARPAVLLGRHRRAS